jgi:hypothetical protein
VSRLQAMELSTASLSTDFEEARRVAIEATDRFHAARDDDPARASLWRDVVTRTEASQSLLLRWLDAAALSDDENYLAPDRLAIR